MNVIQTYINLAIGVGTLVSHIVLLAIVIAIATHATWRGHLYRFVHKHVLNIIFLEALFAIVGSLAYSEIVGFPACDLCWIQRIFIYPQAVLALVAIIKKDKAIVDYLLPMSVIGGLVAFYQSLIHWGINAVSIAGCTAVGAACAKVYVSEFGYITIPFMSFTIFVYSIGVMLIYYQARKIHG
jgi:disulfide bond formation protein DsbB